ncbi:hypothetical protein SAY86_011413 [Trapa natans]|uniref:Uncharacterized protein n=1 Tax=Trapa natans TaxID=22666 RepID=A0AAN7R477_TRANT|nr:hypothetical protein SAY86_011413 [Trapa natans]
MNLVGGWEWVVSKCTKKQGRRWMRRLRAAFKGAIKNSGGGSARKCNFRYDPWSYALNFDDGAGAGDGNGEGSGNAGAAVRISGEGKSGIWVYVLWVKTD